MGQAPQHHPPSGQDLGWGGGIWDEQLSGGSRAPAQEADSPARAAGPVGRDAEVTRHTQF